ncbi:DUF2398 family protein [Kitasatospora sp. NPDC048365]|uniref:DUF2398 family protein n=1 Tax=Kitasatospora sp. NPDC048365 TaxID=3364050 RepID=UPI003712D6B7
MERHEYATGAGEAPGGTGIGRAGGAGRLLAPARTGLYPCAERLADRFAQAPPEDADALYAAVFGLYGARHLGGAPEPSCADSPDTSWWHGPTAHPASLRARPAGYRRVRRDGAGPVEPRGTAAGGRHRKPERAPAADQPETAAERRAAARLLLAQPLVTAGGPHGAGFPLIRRHAGWLTAHFRELLGYSLAVGPTYARLRKAPLPGRGLPGFEPAGYAELALGLAGLAEGREVAAFRPEVRRVLTEWQVLDADGEADRELAVALAPQAEPPSVGPELTVRRLLVETPVVLLDELAPDERSWLVGRQRAETELFADFLGLEAEIRAEGVALLDPADELTDLALPGTGTLPQAALLLAERLVEELRPLPEEAAPPAVLVPDALIDGALGDITDEHGLREGWEPGYLADLTAFRRDALDLLHRMGLIAPAGRNWVLRAPAARYAPQAELHPAPGSGRHSRPSAAPPRQRRPA